MAKKIVSVRDSKVEVFGSPVMCHNLAHGERIFSDLLADSSTEIGKHPEDFSLWCLASYDEVTGTLDTTGCPFKVC